MCGLTALYTPRAVKAWSNRGIARRRGFMALGSRGFLHRTTSRDLDDVGNHEMCRRRKKFLIHALSLGAELGVKTFYVVG